MKIVEWTTFKQQLSVFIYIVILRVGNMLSADEVLLKRC